MAITIKPKPISIFMTAENNPVHYTFYCPFCQRRLFDTNGKLIMMTDNSGPTSELYIETKCWSQNCNRVFRIYGPAPDPKFEPEIRVNGVLLAPA